MFKRTGKNWRCEAQTLRMGSEDQPCWEHSLHQLKNLTFVLEKTSDEFKLRDYRIRSYRIREESALLLG